MEVKDNEYRGHALDRASRRKEGGHAETDLASVVTSVARLLSGFDRDDEL